MEGNKCVKRPQMKLYIFSTIFGRGKSYKNRKQNEGKKTFVAVTAKKKWQKSLLNMQMVRVVMIKLGMRYKMILYLDRFNLYHHYQQQHT